MNDNAYQDSRRVWTEPPALPPWWHRLSRVASLLFLAFALALYLLIATGAVSAWHYAAVVVALVAAGVLGIGEARAK